MIRFLFPVLCAFAFSAVAVADTFTLNGTLSGGGTVTGTIDINITTGIATGGNITANVGSYFASDGGASVYTFNLAPVDQSSNTGPFNNRTIIDFEDVGADEFSLGLPDASLINYNGSAVCSANPPTTNFCYGGFESYLFYAGSYDYLTGHGITDFGPYAAYAEVLTGTLQPMASSLPPPTPAVPEPSSLLLLLTGVAGSAREVRKRFSRR